MQELRRIAVTVEEPDPGRFAWVLMEHVGRTWRVLDRSSASVPSYRAAMSGGLLALQAIVEDLEIGPRADDHAAAEQPAEAPAPGKKKAQRPGSEETAPRKSFFGFGPAR